jgi:phenylalanyl-tRNA synthetase alpha chain
MLSNVKNKKISTFETDNKENMRNKINLYLTEIQSIQPNNKEEVEQFRLKYLSKKGLIPALFNDFKQVSNEEKRELGKVLNELKKLAEEQLDKFQNEFENTATIDSSFDWAAGIQFRW